MNITIIFKVIWHRIIHNDMFVIDYDSCNILIRDRLIHLVILSFLFSFLEEKRKEIYYVHVC